MSDQKIEGIWFDACKAVGDDMYDRKSKWYRDALVPASVEMALCKKEAEAGDPRAIRYWNEFIRRRMTT